MRYKNGLFDVITRFRNHPASNSGEYDLRTVSTFISGYETALLIHGLEELGANFNSEFTKFLKKRYETCSDGDFWVEILEGVSDDPRDSLALFYQLVDEFEREIDKMGK